MATSLIYSAVCAGALVGVTLRSHKSPGLVNYAYYSYFGMFNYRAHAQSTLTNAIGIFKYPHQLLFILQWKLKLFNYDVFYYLKIYLTANLRLWLDWIFMETIDSFGRGGLDK